MQEGIVPGGIPESIKYIRRVAAMKPSLNLNGQKLIQIGVSHAETSLGMIDISLLLTRPFFSLVLVVFYHPLSVLFIFAFFILFPNVYLNVFTRQEFPIEMVKVSIATSIKPLDGSNELRDMERGRG